LVATVVPCDTEVTSVPVVDMASRTFAMPVTKAFDGSVGVDAVLVVTSDPADSSNATTSVKVPPVSMPMRTRRGVVTADRPPERRTCGSGQRSWSRT
jgi:hypothetical protein